MSKYRFSQRRQFYMRPDGSLVEWRWYHTLRFAPRRLWLRLTAPFRPRTVVTRIDAARGVVTMGTQRWSWLRWRWENVG